MWISLVGFHACGKKTVARALGRLDGRRLVDLAVTRVGDLAVAEPLIIATCADSLEQPRTAALLRERSLVVWLDAPWLVVRRRLAPGRGGAPAPIWQELGEAGLEALYRRRRPGYAAAARLRLDARLAPEALAPRLLGRLWSLQPATGQDSP